jgi:hypothetical protein
MASAAEIVFLTTVRTAEGARQVAVQAAYATYLAAGFTPAAMTTYAQAIQTAQDTYTAAVATALATLGLVGKGSNIAPGTIGVDNLPPLSVDSTIEGLS